MAIAAESTPRYVYRRTKGGFTMKRIATLTLIFTLSIVCLTDSSAGLYSPGTWDHTAMATISTLEATHIVVGEVTHVSFVFRQNGSEPLSIVTVRVDKDIKAEIK